MTLPKGFGTQANYSKEKDIRGLVENCSRRFKNKGS